MAIVDGEVILAADILGADTGWTSLDLLAGFTGSARWRLVGKVARLEFDISGSISSERAVTTAIPLAAALPSGTPGGGVNMAAILPEPAGNGAAWVTTTGQLRATARGGTTLTRIRGQATWLVP